MVTLGKKRKLNSKKRNNKYMTDKALLAGFDLLKYSDGVRELDDLMNGKSDKSKDDNIFLF